MIKIKDLDLLKKIDILFENKIILYGAGSYGRKAGQLLKNIKVPILGFCDSNVAKWGEVIEGYRVLSLDEMADIVKEEKCIIIIAMADSNSVEQVLNLLEKYGMEKIDCYTYFALIHTVELNIDDYRIEEAFRKDEKEKEKIYHDYEVCWGRYIALSAMWSIISKGNDILVLQPGKVGSTSVCDSLKKVQVPCIHVHTLTGKSGWGGPPFEKQQEGLMFLRKVEKVRIISLFRDPVARTLAVYFETFNQQYMMRTYPDSFSPDVYKGVTNLLQNEVKKGTCGAMFEWFNTEIKDTFGIDVYQYDFDREKGYQIIRQDNVELLLIKLEKLNDCEEIIGQFAGVENFKLIKSNDANDKLYRFAYEELKRTIEIPQNILDFYYKDNPAMDHFYTPEEKERFYGKWSKDKEYGR